MKVIVLGAGLVGSPMALDLAKDDEFSVSVADYSQSALDFLNNKNSKITGLQIDLTKTDDVVQMLRDYDYVINAVPGFMGFGTAKAILQAGKNSTCIAFYEEDPFQLDALAKEKNVTMIMDCGVVPGMVGTLIMDSATKLDHTESAIIYVGGLPEVREWPSDYKAVFSPVDVIEEYIRPARYIENGRKVTRPALSDPEMIYFPQVGTLEAFNTDGIRTLAQTINTPNIKEKTLRYPGHMEKMSILRELGFFSKEKTLDVNGQKISPLEFTGKVLFPNWKLKKGEVDLTILKAVVEGTKDNQKIRFTLDLFDKYDRETDTHSMARTTGYTATSALRMIIKGLYSHKGISPAEYIGKHPACVEFMLNELKQRGVNWVITKEMV